MESAEARKRESARNLNFQQLDRQSKQLDSQINRNKQQLRQIEKAEQIFTDIQIRKQNQLEELSQNWKGQHALSVLSEAMSNHQAFHRQQIRQIHERKRNIAQSTRSLYQKQETLTRAKRLAVRGDK